jgi:hypothetical protein
VILRLHVVAACAKVWRAVSRKKSSVEESRVQGTDSLQW